jgi:hypothetical protein
MARPEMTGARIAATGSVLIAVALALVVADIMTLRGSTAAMWLTWPSWAIGGFGMGLAYTPVSLASLSIAARPGPGAAASAIVLAETVGALLGMAAGAMLATGVSPGTALLGHTGPAFAFFALITVPLAGVVRRIRGPAPAAAEARLA